MPRGDFHRPYVERREDRLWRKQHRLMDLMTVIVPEGDPEYLAEPEPGEFCVIDTRTREKGYFEHAPGLDADRITGMASSHFEATAVQVGPSLWFV